MPIAQMTTLSRAIMAEFLATGLFVWAGCGAACAVFKWGVGGDVDAGAIVGIAIAFGFAISYLAYGIGHISGGHINPAVTLSFFLLKKIDAKKFVGYSIAQYLGAVLGAAVLWGCIASQTSDCDNKCEAGETPDADGCVEFTSNVCEASEKTGGGYGPPFGLAANGLGGKVSLGSGFLLETVGTYILVFTVLMSAAHSKSSAGNAAPIAIGWSVMGAHLVMVPFTGCGINPARTFGPFLVDSFGGVNKWQRGWWIFFVAPYFGSMLATATFHFLFRLQFTSYSHKDEIDEEDGDVTFREVKEEKAVEKKFDNEVDEEAEETA